VPDIVITLFALGILAGLARSDLQIPKGTYDTLSILLMLAIGLKGGVALHGNLSLSLVPELLSITALGFLIPLALYPLLRKLIMLNEADSASFAAHYGSVSAVTFIASLSYVDSLGMPAEGFMPAVLALMEVPAIVIALMLAREGRSADGLGTALHEVLAGRSILLLAGGLAIGFAAGPRGYEAVRPFFADPFQGALCLFLLDLGMVAALRFKDVRAVGRFLVAFAVVAPLVNGAAGVAAGWAVGLSPGGSAVLGTLAASASYIAAPAAVRLALPSANPGYYLTASLALTFPFNLVAGLPLYAWFARFLHG